MRFLKLLSNWIAFVTLPIWSLPVFLGVLAWDIYTNDEATVKTFMRGERWFWE